MMRFFLNTHYHSTHSEHIQQSWKSYQFDLIIIYIYIYIYILIDSHYQALEHREYDYIGMVTAHPTQCTNRAHEFQS